MAYLISLMWLAISIMAALQGKDGLSDFSAAVCLFFVGVAMIIGAIRETRR